MSFLESPRQPWAILPVQVGEAMPKFTDSSVHQAPCHAPRMLREGHVHRPLMEEFSLLVARSRQGSFI